MASKRAQVLIQQQLANKSAGSAQPRVPVSSRRNVAPDHAPSRHHQPQHHQHHQQQQPPPPPQSQRHTRDANIRNVHADNRKYPVARDPTSNCASGSDRSNIDVPSARNGHQGAHHVSPSPDVAANRAPVANNSRNLVASRAPVSNGYNPPRSRPLRNQAPARAQFDQVQRPNLVGQQSAGSGSQKLSRAAPSRDATPPLKQQQVPPRPIPSRYTQNSSSTPVIQQYQSRPVPVITSASNQSRAVINLTSNQSRYVAPNHAPSGHAPSKHIPSSRAPINHTPSSHAPSTRPTETRPQSVEVNSLFREINESTRATYHCADEAVISSIPTLTSHQKQHQQQQHQQHQQQQHQQLQQRKPEVHNDISYHRYLYSTTLLFYVLRMYVFMIYSSICSITPAYLTILTMSEMPIDCNLDNK